jgi:hypothetical protein
MTQLPLWNRILHLPIFFQFESTFFYFISFSITVSIVALFLALIHRMRFSPFKRWIGFWSVAWIGVSLYSIIKPGTEFTHHLLILVLPIGWMTAMAAEIFLLSKFAVRFQAMPLTFLLCNVLIGLKTVLNYHHDPAATNYYLHAFNIRHVHKNSAVSDILKKHAKPKDYLVVWGWNLRYHVETQLAQGTSENHSFRSIVPHSLRKAYQDKYIEDIATTKPALFVDATGPNSLWMNDTTVYKHEKFAALATYISKRYRLIKTIDKVRIYLRNDRIISNSIYRKLVSVR